MKRARRELEAKASEARGLSEEFIKVTDGQTDTQTDRQSYFLSSGGAKNLDKIVLV